MQGFKNRRYEYEEKFVLGGGDSHSDSRTDGGTDRTGNNELHGLRAILTLNIKKEGLAEMRVLPFLSYFNMPCSVLTNSSESGPSCQ